MTVSMTLDSAVRLFELLLGWSLLVQTWEMWRIRHLDQVSD
ncbi:MAG: hypothetical protein RI949_2718, partial [Pseudomonadota bacterium]